MQNKENLNNTQPLKKIPTYLNKRTLEDINTLLKRYKLTWENRPDFYLSQDIKHLPKYFDINIRVADLALYAYEHMETCYRVLKPFYDYPVGFVFTPNDPNHLPVLVSSKSNKGDKWTYLGNETIEQYISMGILEKIELNCEQYEKYVGGFFNQIDEENYDGFDNNE